MFCSKTAFHNKDVLNSLACRIVKKIYVKRYIWREAELLFGEVFTHFTQ